MVVRIKQDRTRKSGYRGSMNAQDFEWKPPNYRQSLRRNTQTALNLMTPAAERAGLGEDVTWLTAKAAMLNLLDSLRGDG